MCNPVFTPRVVPEQGKGLNVMPPFGQGQVVEELLGLVWASDGENMNKKMRN